MAVRNFMDQDGREWRVWNVTPGAHQESSTNNHLPEEMAEGWLCFDQGEEKRRLAPLPPGWSDRSDEELSELCRSAVPARSPAKTPA